ncbi:MAG TPA: DUF3854 domain-containing protein [Stellaceae bacterium]
MEQLLAGAEPAHFQAGRRSAADESGAALPQHVRLAEEYLSVRGIAFDVANAAGLVPGPNARQLDKTFKRRPALAIPYFDPLTGAPATWSDGGKQRAFMRVRYLGDEPRGFLPPSVKQQRYDQPAGSPVRAYFPCGTGIDWPKVLADPQVPLVMTEGEVKAIAACDAGIPTIGLGGVDSFTNDGAFLPELATIAWQSRQVIVCYDSDRAGNPAIQAAEKRLAQELRRRGAVVLIATIPPADDGVKVGLDDYVALYGAERTELMLLAAEPAPGKPVITLKSGKLNESLEELDAAFVASGEPVYQRAGVLVRVANAGETARIADLGTGHVTEEGITRTDVAPVIRVMEVRPCQQLASRAATFLKSDGRSKKGPVEADCTPVLAEHYLDKADGWRVPGLRRIVEAPTLRTNGTVLQTPGYDAASQLLYLPSVEFPRIADKPSRDEACAAYERLCRPMRTYPFTPEAKAVWAAAVITALVRPVLPSAPLFGFSATAAGSGKTKAAEIVGYVATGHTPASMPQARDREEERKRITSLLLSGDPVALVDNCTRPIESDIMCQVLTGAIFKDRILSLNKTVEVPTTTTFLVTGNNLVFKGDITTRALVCHIEPNIAHPETRTFDFDPLDEVKSGRPELVGAALTIMRAYFAAGCPKVKAPAWRFHDWQRFVHFPLLWAGAADPLLTRAVVEASDPDREAAERLISLFAKVFGSRRFTVRDIADLHDIAKPGRADMELFVAACEATDSQIRAGQIGRDMLNAKKMGNYLAAHAGMIASRWRLARAGDNSHAGAAEWRLIKV